MTPRAAWNRVAVLALGLAHGVLRLSIRIGAGWGGGATTRAVADGRSPPSYRAGGPGVTGTSESTSIVNGRSSPRRFRR